MLGRPLQHLARATPWYAKMVVKMAASRLPLSHGFWRDRGLFRHGAMDTPAEAWAVLTSTLERAGLGPRLDGLRLLELGPGDALTSALIAHGLGAKSSLLVDEAGLARRDLEPYLRCVAYLAERGLEVARLAEARTLEELLERCGARYLTAGLESLRELPAQSVDVELSNAVLEHVRLGAFFPTLLELRRLLAPGGVASHRIDLRDHLGFALNNLRFSERVWESELMARSGFYTNRIRYTAMLELFRRAGFEPAVVAVRRFERLPTPRRAMQPAWRELPDEDLLVHGFDVVLRPV